MRVQRTCPFCRKPLPKKKEERDKQLMKRIEANDPAAMCHLGIEKRKEEDYSSAFE